MSVSLEQTYPDWVPNQITFPSEGNVADVLLQDCRRYADRTAFACAEDTLSYRELEQLSERLAVYLLSECRLNKGDRVAVMMPNLIAYPISVLGILRAGLVVVNVNPLYTARELKHQLVDSGAKAIIIAQPFLAALDEALPDTVVENVLLTPMAETVKPSGLYGGEARIALNDALSVEGDLDEVAVVPNDVAFLQYTGGTTGPSKGATLSHGNIMANQQQLLGWIEPCMAALPDQDQHVVITALPLYHIFALTVNALAMMHHGACNVLVPNPRDLPALVDTFKRYPVSMFSAVNTLFNGLLHTPGFDQVDFSRLCLAAGGGASVQAAVAQRWQAVTGKSIVEGYGLSETSPLVTLNAPDAGNHSGTVGFAMPSTDIVLLDEQDNPVADGEPGELCVRGPQVMVGYWNRPDANAEVFTDDGYFRTGDIAVRYANGSYQIVDRKKDMILVSGFNVYPAEIEAVCASHEAVVESACVGVPDERTGEAVKVFVVRSSDALKAEQLIAYCRDNLTPYKVPRQVEFLAELPKSPVGKILRRELRGLIQRSHLGRTFHNASRRLARGVFFV